MADFNKDFDNYKLYYNSHHPNQLEAVIHCFKGHVYVGNIVFYDDGGAIPANNIQVNNVPVTATVNYALSRFADVMNILRYEKPVHLFVSESVLNGWVATGTGELVGEQET